MPIDVHTHYVPPLPDFLDRFGDQRWPSFQVRGDAGRLVRDGAVVRAVPSSSWDLDRRLVDMDSTGIDRQVLSPLPPLICDWADPAPAMEWCERLNDGIAAAVAEHPSRFSGFGTVPVQHPDLAVVVLEKARAAGLTGVEIGTTAGARELDHADLREFFAAAAELQMVVFVHPLILGADAGWTDRITGEAVTFGLGMTTDTAIAAAKLVFGGVVQGSPGLRLCLSHGGGTFAWALPRITRAWALRSDVPAADLMTHVWVDSVVYRSSNLRYLRDTLGAERVLFGTDYPLPAQDDLRGGVFAELDAADRNLMMDRNARDLLGLEQNPDADLPAGRP